MPEKEPSGPPRRNRTRAARQKVDGVIEYDLTQEKETGRSRARSTNPVSSRGRRRGTPSATSPQVSLGPSGLPLLRTSERGTFKRCHWLWKLEFVDLLKPNYDTPALMFGSMIHEGLAGYYIKGKKRGTHPTTGFLEAVGKEAERVGKNTGLLPGDLLDEWRERIELGMAILNNYIDTYANDEDWEVLGTELPFQVIVPHPRDNVTPWFWYTGVLDLLVLARSTKRKMIVDHKTTAAIQTKYLALDQQTTAYWTWGVEALRKKGLIGQTEKLDGLLFNFLRKAAPDERPFRIENGTKFYLNQPTKKNPEGEISKSQPAPYFRREPIWRAQLQQDRAREQVIGEMLDMQAIRRELERSPEKHHSRIAYKNNGKFTCQGCWAFDICELHEAGADHQAMTAETTHNWDPYEVHEIYFSETR